MASATSFYDFQALDSSEKNVSFDKYKGKVVLIVNTASECGFTYQYEDLKTVWLSMKEKYPEDFVILAFPCNQFLGQEPGSNEEIQNFCTKREIPFPIMAKIDVKGANAHPLYNWLKAERPSMLRFIGWDDVKWNFEKFLIGRDGKVKGRWLSTTKPQALKSNILEELEKAA